MELEKYLQDFDNAQRNQDHFKMMAAMQEFFSKIHGADHREGFLLGIYSMASQLETTGINANAIKAAVRSRVASQYAETPYTWKAIAVGLNALLESDAMSDQKITIVN